MGSAITENYKLFLSNSMNNFNLHFDNLAALADKNIQFAADVVDAIFQHIQSCSRHEVLAFLYLVDFIIKKIGKEYITIFSERIVLLFEEVFRKVDKREREEIYKLRTTWKSIFPEHVLYALDVRVHELDSSWPINSLSSIQNSRNFTRTIPNSVPLQSLKLYANNVQIIGDNISVAEYTVFQDLRHCNGRRLYPMNEKGEGLYQSPVKKLKTGKENVERKHSSFGSAAHQYRQVEENQRKFLFQARGEDYYPNVSSSYHLPRQDDSLPCKDYSTSGGNSSWKPMIQNHIQHQQRFSIVPSASIKTEPHTLEVISRPPGGSEERFRRLDHTYNEQMSQQWTPGYGPMQQKEEYMNHSSISASSRSQSNNNQKYPVPQTHSLPYFRQHHNMNPSVWEKIPVTLSSRSSTIPVMSPHAPSQSSASRHLCPLPHENESKIVPDPLPFSMVDVHSLYAKLEATGILTKPSAAEQDNTIEVGNGGENLSAKDLVELNIQNLRLKRHNIINALYEGNECATCGMRFKLTDEYRHHLDWHFQINRQAKANAKKAMSRPWCLKKENWLLFENIENPGENVPNFFELQAMQKLKPAAVKVPSAASTKENESCLTCNEVFEQYWIDDEEEWHLRNAVRHEGQAFHPLCLKDFLKVSLPKVSDLIENDSMNKCIKKEPLDVYIKKEPLDVYIKKEHVYDGNNKKLVFAHVKKELM